MAGSLEPVWHKVNRADQHRHDFARLVRDLIESDAYSITFEFDTDSGWHEFRWKVNDPPPLHDFALVFGDFLSNLRSTLDYLVWQLVLLNGKRPTDRTMFPVVRKREAWRGVRGDRLDGVSDLCARKIRQLQPYLRADRPEAHPLAVLDYVNNVNKHRVLPVSIVTLDSLRIEGLHVPAGELQQESFTDRPIRDGDLLFRFRRPEDRLRLQFDSHSKPTLRVSFRNGIEAGWTNDDMFDYVVGIIRLFEPAFGG